MNSQPSRETIQDVTARTLEGLALMFLVPAEQSPEADMAVGAEVAFHGPVEGRLLLAASEGVLCELATNMLGLDADAPPTEHQEDALRELGNVICGNLLPALYGAEAVFHIDAPVSASTKCVQEAAGRHSETMSAWLHTDCGRVLVALCVHDAVAATSG